MPLAFLAAILSRVRSSVTSCSNCAKDSRLLSKSHSVEVVLLNCWVINTKLTPLQSNELGKVCEAADESVDFVDHQDVDPPGLDVFEQAPKGQSFHLADRIIDIVVAGPDYGPAPKALADLRV